MRRMVVTLVATLLLTGCYTPVELTPGQIAANKALLSVADACIVSEAQNLDDGFSDPTTIANAILAACDADIEKVVSAFVDEYHLSYTNAPRFQQEREKDYLQIATLAVLQHRKASKG